MNGELHRALKQVKDLGLVEDLHDREAVKKILYKRGENHLALLVDEFCEHKYAELIDRVNNMKSEDEYMNNNMEEQISKVAEGLGATYQGSMTLRTAMEAIDDMKIVKEGFTQVLNSRGSMRLSDGFCAYLQCELDSVSKELMFLEEALSRCPNVRTQNEKGEKVEKNVFVLWADYANVLDTKKQMEGFINSEFIVPSDKAKYIELLDKVDKSKSVMDFYLDHCILAMAEMND